MSIAIIHRNGAAWSYTVIAPDLCRSHVVELHTGTGTEPLMRYPSEDVGRIEPKGANWHKEAA